MSKQRDFFDHFYKLIDHEEWLSGIELYQEHMVQQVRQEGELVSGVIANTNGGSCRVSIKIHDSRRFIQWMECNCQLNRRYGRYCRHLTALLLQLGVENPLLAKLDTSTSPFPTTKAPRATRREPPPSSLGEKSHDQPAVSGGTGLYSYLQASIREAALVGRGPHIRIVMDSGSDKAGKNHILSIDDSAQFMRKHSGDPKRAKLFKNLSVFDKPAFLLGTILSSEPGEKIFAERVVGLNRKGVSTSLVDELLDAGARLGRFTPMKADQSKHQLQEVIYFPFKSLEKKVGHAFVFISGLGYFPLEPKCAKEGWFDLPYKKSLVGDEAGMLIHRGYADFMELAPLWITSDLPVHQKVQELRLANLNLEQGLDSFFYLSPYYKIGKEEIPMLDFIKQARDKKRSFFRSGETWIQIPDIITEFPWQIDPHQGKIKATALELTRLKVLLNESDNKLSKEFARLDTSALLQFDTNAPLPTYNTNSLQLRNYQLVGLKWLWWLYQQNLHGLLADEMGLGKTHQAMALMSAITKQAGKEGKKYFLVICPTTVIAHWHNKLTTFLPELKTLTFYGSDRSAQLSSFLGDCDILVTSYRLLLHDSKKLSDVPWSLVILDEAHYIKNHRTATYKAACSLKSTMRLCLSGTPMENHLSELKNIFDFLVPGYLGSDEYFRKHYAIPIEQEHNKQAEANLQMLIKPLKLRRSKSNVLTELPAKLEEIKQCFLSPEQVRMYRSLLQEKAAPLVQQLKDSKDPIPYLHVFAVLQFLKQICNHPASVLEKADYKKHQSGKFELFKELLGEALDSGNKVVVFSQYLKMIEIINQYCQDEGIQCIALTGSSKNRGQLIERFQSDPGSKVFVSSLLTGGVGIDLTAASTVIHYDRWWNASKEDQATDRVHRIGQKNFVHIMKLVTAGTLEEKIANMIAKKQKLVEKFLDHDSSISTAFTREELILLLQQ